MKQNLGKTKIKRIVNRIYNIGGLQFQWNSSVQTGSKLEPVFNFQPYIEIWFLFFKCICTGRKSLIRFSKTSLMKLSCFMQELNPKHSVLYKKCIPTAWKCNRLVAAWLGYSNVWLMIHWSSVSLSTTLNCQTQRWMGNENSFWSKWMWVGHLVFTELTKLGLSLSF